MTTLQHRHILNFASGLARAKLPPELLPDTKGSALPTDLHFFLHPTTISSSFFDSIIFLAWPQ
jgi:hypothetical protein